MQGWNCVWCFLIILRVNSQELRIHRTPIPFIDGSYSNKQMLLSAGVSNPASLTRMEGFGASAEMEATWLLRETGLFSGLLFQPFGQTIIGIAVTHNGSPDLKQSTISFLLSRNLGVVQLGTEFLFHQFIATGFPSSGKVDGGIYCRFEVSPVFNAGFRIRNVSGFFSRQANAYASIVQAGVGYDVSSVIQLGCEWMQEHSSSPIITSGLLYRFHVKFLLMTGINWSPCQPYGGFQLNHKDWKLFIKTSFHPVLGWSPSIGISFGKTKDQE